MKRPHQSLTLAAITSFLVLAACHPIQAPSAGSEKSATAAPARTTTPSHTATFDSTKYENVWVQAIEEIENDGRSLLRISHPVTEQEAINARMEAVTQEFIDEYRMVAAEIERSYQDYKSETGKEAATFVTHYRQHFDVSVANKNLIFFDLLRSIDTGGTGNSYVVGYIFDRRSGAELTIPELFVDFNYLNRLSDRTKKALEERVSKEELASDADWIVSGTAPTVDNFDNILFQNDGTVLVRFDKYQVAAGVEGVVEVVLPLAAIADLLKPEIQQLLGILEDSKIAAVTAMAVSENDDRSQLYVSYPVTDQEAINVRIEEISQQFIDEFRMTAAEIEEAFQDYKKETGQEAASFVTHFRQDHELSVANGQVIFIAVTRSRFTGGTGNTSVSSYSFDLQSGAELTIPELFADDSYLERLSELTRETLAERARSWFAEQDQEALFESEYQLIETGTTPTAENFDFIVFRDGGSVLIKFDKYQVASGVFGVVEVEFDVDAISDLLEPEIRRLLGVEAGEATAITEFAKALENVRAATVPNLPVMLGANLPTVMRASSLAVGLASSPAEDGINCHEVACVALTFDDGPSRYTEGLLDTLKEHDVKATFFVLGAQVRIQSETVYRIFEEGHQIGNHTWDHPNLTQMSDAQIREQLQLTDDLITQIIGVPTPFLRPPYGAYNDRVLAATGVPIIFWSVDPLDWRDRDAEVVAARIIKSPVGAIILAHDIHRTTVAAVPAIIATLKGRGIHFVTVAKLFEPQTLLPENVYINQPDSPSE